MRNNVGEILEVLVFLGKVSFLGFLFVLWIKGCYEGCIFGEDNNIINTLLRVVYIEVYIFVF